MTETFSRWEVSNPSNGSEIDSFWNSMDFNDPSARVDAPYREFVSSQGYRGMCLWQWGNLADQLLDRQTTLCKRLAGIRTPDDNKDDIPGLQGQVFQNVALKQEWGTEFKVLSQLWPCTLVEIIIVIIPCSQTCRYPACTLTFKPPTRFISLLPDWNFRILVA
jgi:hypothetical protein